VCVCVCLSVCVHRVCVCVCVCVCVVCVCTWSLFGALAAGDDDDEDGEDADNNADDDGDDDDGEDADECLGRLPPGTYWPVAPWLNQSTREQGPHCRGVPEEHTPYCRRGAESPGAAPCVALFVPVRLAITCGTHAILPFHAQLSLRLLYISPEEHPFHAQLSLRLLGLLIILITYTLPTYK